MKKADLLAQNEVLRASEKRLRTVVDNTPVVLFALDQQGRFTLSEGKGLAVLGLQPGQVVGQSSFEVYRDSPSALAGIRRALAGEEFSTEVEVGGLVFEVWYSPVRNAAGDLIGTIGVATDVTERTKAAHGQQTLASIIEASSDLIGIADLNAHLLYLNPAGLRLVGLDSLEDVKHKTVRDFHVEEDFRRFETEILPSVFQTGHWAGEITFRHFKTGRPVPFDMNAFMIREQSTGRPIALANISRDVTERRRVEGALRDSRDLLQTVLNTIPARVFWKDLDLRYLGCNLPFALDAGLESPEQMIGKNDYQMGWREQAELYRGDDRRVLESGVPKIHYEEPQTTPDGRRLWLRTSKVPLRSAEGAIWGVLGTYEDITDRKQAEAERERLIHELEQRNAELERFTYTVSHDLKSPLITMSGFLGFLEKDALAGNAEGLMSDIERIKDATGKMDRLLRELLELSRIGRVANPPERVPFEEIAREAVGLTGARLQERGVRVEIAPGMPAVSGDRVRLVEVVQNLVENAAKFMGSQPEPLVEIGARPQERGGMPVFVVRDNGIGIEPRYHERIFGLFDKLSPGTEGTGIGLALVKRIVEVHGGQVWVESQGGGSGTTFCFTLPRAGT